MDADRLGQRFDIQFAKDLPALFVGYQSLQKRTRGDDKGVYQMAQSTKPESVDLIKSWSGEMLNEIFTLANEKKIPENLALNGVGMSINYLDGSKINVNFTFNLVKGGKG